MSKITVKDLRKGANYTNTKGKTYFIQEIDEKENTLTIKRKGVVHTTSLSGFLARVNRKIYQY